MCTNLIITLAQINPIVGDLAYNAARIEEIWTTTKSDLIVFPELSLCGYTPEDLLLKPSFLDAVDAHLQNLTIVSANHQPAILIGASFRRDGQLFNAVHLIAHGKLLATICKHHLPNYGVFDDARVFASAPLPKPVLFKGHKLGILICEDLWYPHVAEHLAQAGAEVLIAANASPYDNRKAARRLAAARACTSLTNLPLIYVNQIGGQDETVYDGGSFALDATGTVIAQAAQFREEILSIAWPSGNASQTPLLDPLEADYTALVTGLRDYVTKNGFTGVLLGLSGGIDSALCAAIAVDALGADNVQGVLLPSRYTSKESLTDATALGKNLGIALQTYAIADTVDALENTLAPLFKSMPDSPATDLTHQNIQPRARGTILMALSNATGCLLLTTGNKSEIAVGYSTLYGDMCGGFNPLKDVYKTHVYALAKWRNRNGIVIPQNTIIRAPTAELKPGQTDQDTLPPYEILDAILQGLLEDNLGVAEITARGHARETVVRVAHLINRAEYKRRQAAPGPKITPCAFGRERRYPITNRFSA